MVPSSSTSFTLTCKREYSSRSVRLYAYKSKTDVWLIKPVAPGAWADGIKLKSKEGKAFGIWLADAQTSSEIKAVSGYELISADKQGFKYLKQLAINYVSFARLRMH